MKAKEETKMNIYQKLLEIQRGIIGLGKDKDTKSQQNPNGYAYVTGSKVLENIKPLMNKYGLLLKQEVLSAENTRQDYATKYGNKSEILTKVMMKFTWVDCDTGEKDENLFGANGQNDWEKGFGSALTYAERYFLLKYFHIATDEDDIDNDERKTTAPVQIQEPTVDAKVANMAKPDAEIPIAKHKAVISKIESAVGLAGYYNSLTNPEKVNPEIVESLKIRREELKVVKP